MLLAKTKEVTDFYERWQHDKQLKTMEINEAFGLLLAHPNQYENNQKLCDEKEKPPLSLKGKSMETETTRYP